MERADKVIGPLCEGRRYLVPTVRGEWLDWHGIADWPVVGPRHKDPEIGVNVSHYHIDHRFVPTEQFQGGDTNTVVNESCDQPVRYRAWTCLQACVVLTHRESQIRALHDSWRGRQCQGSRESGWICPHRGVWLGSQPAVKGVITCPAHGLKIEPLTGRVM